MGKRQLLINLVSNVLGFLLSLSISLVLTPFLIAKIGKESYGFFPLSNNLVGYMAIISIALNSMVARFITIAIADGRSREAQGYFSSTLYANWALASFLAVPMGAIVIWVDRLINVAPSRVFEVRLLFTLVFASMLVDLLATAFGVTAFAYNRMELKAMVDIVKTLLRAGLLFVLFSALDASIVFLGIVALAISLTNLALQYSLSRYLAPSMKADRSLVDLGRIRTLVGAGAWNSLNSLGSLLLMGVGLLLSNVLLGESASGTLAIVQTVPNFMSTVIVTVYAVLLPRITLVYARRSPEELLAESRFSQKVLAVFATVPGLLFIVVGEAFYRQWVPGEDSNTLQMLSVISMVPMLIHGNMWTVYGLGLTAAVLRGPSMMLVLAGVLNVGLTVLIVSWTHVGLLAIPVVNLAINCLYYLTYLPLYISHKLGFPKHVFYVSMLRTLAFGLLFLFIGSGVARVFPLNDWVGIGLFGLLFGALGFLVHGLFLLDRSDLWMIRSALQKR